MPVKNLNLVIVESPAKARTIQSYLGSDFSVVSSFGHIRDLPKKDLGVDIDNLFSPSYEVPADKKKVVSDLKKQAKGTEVWLASDEDREGEAIAWHVCHVLGLDPSKTKRIVFHEITKSAIQQAVKNPRNVNERLVDAQQARRVLDRLVGYQLSPVLWKKVQAGLSAGRVQSVAVRLIVEREREIDSFEPKASYKITASLLKNGQPFEAEYSQKLEQADKVHKLLKHCSSAKLSVGPITQRPALRNPSPPFTTSTLQQEASRRLGFSVKQTMTLAQRLYEAGHITYMRTDSLNLSSEAQTQIGNYIMGRHGAEYLKQRGFKNKNTSAQEAHEAIRPTKITDEQAGADANQTKLYQLIWRRTIASQMSSSRLLKTEAMVTISDWSEGYFIGRGEVLEFDGFMKVYGRSKEDVLLPQLSEGENLDYVQIEATQAYSRAPARYSEASLVSKLEELGIGRPSTYAPTISVIQDRGYVEKKDLEGRPLQSKKIILQGSKISEQDSEIVYGADRAKLLPTYLAQQVTDFLSKHFTQIVDYEFTAKAEDEFDKIAAGKLEWQKMIASFYKDFAPLIKKSETISRSETAKQRLLGSDPKTKEPIYARYGRFGPMLQRGDTNSDQKPVFAPLPADSTLESVELSEALPMFELPRKVGTTESGQEIVAGIGRFGPYIQVDKKYTSIKEYDPFTISEAQAREVLATKSKAQEKEVLADFGEIKVLKGPYGPYATNGKKNARIPKTLEPDKITLAQAEELLAKAPARRGRRGRTKSV